MIHNTNTDWKKIHYSLVHSEHHIGYEIEF